MPLLLGTGLEVNPLTLGLMIAAAVVHEGTAAVDVWTASRSERKVTQFEQHVHSFLEVMPFWIIPLMALVHRPIARTFRLRLREPRLADRHIALIAACVVGGAVLPYGEELTRCVRYARLPIGRPSHAEGSGST